MNDEFSSIGARLRYSIKSCGISYKQFSRNCGIPYRSIQQYLRDERKPGSGALTKISAQLGISADWILTGEGEMRRSTDAILGDKRVTSAESSGGGLAELNMMEFKNRVESIVDARGTDLKKLCAECGIAYSTMQKYVLMGRPPNVDTLLKLSAYTGVNIHWLVTGQGDMYGTAAEGSGDVMADLNRVAKDLTHDQRLALLAIARLFKQ